jgi:protocatechuate 3,4-dioxygenase beta subunit
MSLNRASSLLLPELVGRRAFLQTAAVGSAAMIAWYSQRGRFAEDLMVTPSMTEGPFYPDRLPLDTDNDLLIITDSITPAVGEITHLSGRVLGKSGSPIVNALVEIWQVDNNASYIHSRGKNPDGFDGNFQGYGRFLTDRKGQYYFRTIKPVKYTVGGAFRTPHIHFAVSKNGHRILTSQLLIRGDENNERDGLFQQIRDKAARESILADFLPIPESKFGELAADFDIVIGKTAEELEDGTLKPPARRKG